MSNPNDIFAGSICITTIRCCGGSPSNPARWSRTGETRRVMPDAIRPNPDSAWPEVTHYHGRATCRLATPAEITELEAAEAAGTRTKCLWNRQGAMMIYFVDADGAPLYRRAVAQ